MYDLENLWNSEHDHITQDFLKNVSLFVKSWYPCCDINRLGLQENSNEIRVILARIEGDSEWFDGTKLYDCPDYWALVTVTREEDEESYNQDLDAVDYIPVYSFIDYWSQDNSSSYIIKWGVPNE